MKNIWLQIILYFLALKDDEGSIDGCELYALIKDVLEANGQVSLQKSINYQTPSINVTSQWAKSPKKKQSG